MIKTKEEIISSIDSLLAEATTDEALALIEDIADTIDSYEAKITELSTSDGIDWEAKYNENDEMWRKRYKERFLSNEEIPEEPEQPEDGATVEIEIKNFEDLFTKEN